MSNSTDESQSNDFVAYLLLSENCIMLLAKMITVGLVGHLAFAINFRANTMRVSELSASMWIYLATHFIGSIISFPYVLHILVLSS